MQRCAFNRFLFEVQGFASPLHLQDPSRQYCVWASYWSWFWKYSLSGFFTCVFQRCTCFALRSTHTPLPLAHSFCDIALSIRHTHRLTHAQRDAFKDYTYHMRVIYPLILVSLIETLYVFEHGSFKVTVVTSCAFVRDSLTALALEPCCAHASFLLRSWSQFWPISNFHISTTQTALAFPHRRRRMQSSGSAATFAPIGSWHRSASAAFSAQATGDVEPSKEKVTELSAEALPLPLPLCFLLFWSCSYCCSCCGWGLGWGLAAPLVVIVVLVLILVVACCGWNWDCDFGCCACCTDW